MGTKTACIRTLYGYASLRASSIGVYLKKPRRLHQTLPLLVTLNTPKIHKDDKTMEEILDMLGLLALNVCNVISS